MAMPPAPDPSRTSYACYAITAPGLEAITSAELGALGYKGRVETGGISFRTDAAGLVRANIELRTASRVVVRIGHFEAGSFSLLESRARRIPWDAYVAPGSLVRFRVTSHKSKLYHQDAIAQRLLESVAHRVGSVSRSDGDDDEEGDSAGSEQLFVVRFAHDQCTISADSSGALLHRRGYRLAGGKAPMRETLAAAMLLAVGWDGAEPLLDPFCGSGTIPIEAALLARRIAPNLGRALARELACQHWSAFHADAAARPLEEAQARVRPSLAVPIVGSDRDGEVIAAAGANAARAGVPEIDFRVAVLSAVDPPPAPGWVVTNPPYGVRLGDEKKLRGLYGQLGQLMRGKLLGWKLAMLETHRGIRRFSGLTMNDVWAARNGGIKVRLVTSGYRSAPAAEALP
jgi:putative N6-adenine-specific DNA methylase